MTTDARPLRADAQRNRDRLLTAAATAFARDSGASLDSIARDAGVGIGTLYRHFPTREALVEATYRNELNRLCDAADELLTDQPPDVALRAWMDRLIDYMAAKHGMADALRALIAAGGNPFAASRSRLTAALTTLLDAGVEQGLLRGEVAADDILVGLSGLAMHAAPDRRDQLGRLLDLLMDGLRRHP
ncbi:TetR/AcrR family transcriptional regulator [Actinocatenispora thailandica]|uniref:TetR/AcrR family transcriptional regulator n=1 Tax=Actinocatenispora thailandica TaxID=227318 RepID=UPI0031D0C7A6